MIVELGLRDACFDGCRFGVIGAGRLPALKPWRVCTSRDALFDALHGIFCLRRHVHGRLEGAATAQSGVYTLELCLTIFEALLAMPGRAVADPPEPLPHGAILLDEGLAAGTDLRIQRLEKWLDDRRANPSLAGSPAWSCPDGDTQEDDSVPQPLFSTDSSALGAGVSVLKVWLAAFSESSVPFAAFARRFARGDCVVLGGRHRDVLPLPVARPKDLLWPRAARPELRQPLLLSLNFAVAGLNWLHKGGRPSPVPLRASALHRAVLTRLFDKLLLAVSTAGEATGATAPSSSGAFARVAGLGANGKYPDLVAARVDVADTCGVIDPLPFFSPDAAAVINSVDDLFPGGTSQLVKDASFAAGPRSEYVRLVCAQLRAGKLGLAGSAEAAGPVFVVGKSGSDRLREIWHGGALTRAAASPPKPPLQATPAALGHLEASRDRPLRVTGRDASAWFDQLRLPAHLRSFMGRPPVQVSELCDPDVAGDACLSVTDLDAFWIGSGDLGAHTSVVPLSLVWPMGFGWSSYAAQATMVDSVLSSGFSADRLLCEESTLPPPWGPVISVATDDVLLFERVPAGPPPPVASSPLQSLDQVWKERGIRAQSSKCFEQASSAVALCIMLKDGVGLIPPPARLVDVFLGGADLLRGGRCAPLELASFGGLLQWFDLLNRPLYSCLGALFAFSRSDPQTTVVPVWPVVLSEIALNIALFPL